MHSTARACIYRAPGECQCCPSCGSSRLYELDLLTLQRPINGCRTGFVSGCDGCGLVFSNPQPTAEELRRFYSPTGEWGARRVGVSKTPDVPRRATRGRSWSKAFGPIRDFVTTPRPGATALDFGCGDGALLDALQESGWDTSGIETAVDCAFPRHHRLDAVPGAPVFDLIVANHVLEHVTDPLGLLRQFARAGRVGGYLFIGVPRFDTLPIHRDYKVRDQWARTRDRVHMAMPAGSTRASRLEVAWPTTRSGVQGAVGAHMRAAAGDRSAHRGVRRAGPVAGNRGTSGSPPVLC
jgi:hypothetical protein